MSGEERRGVHTSEAPRTHTRVPLRDSHAAQSPSNEPRWLCHSGEHTLSRGPSGAHILYMASLTQTPAAHRPHWCSHAVQRHLWYSHAVHKPI